MKTTCSKMTKFQPSCYNWTLSGVWISGKWSKKEDTNGCLILIIKAKEVRAVFQEKSNHPSYDVLSLMGILGI